MFVAKIATLDFLIDWASDIRKRCQQKQFRKQLDSLKGVSRGIVIRPNSEGRYDILNLTYDNLSELHEAMRLNIEMNRDFDAVWVLNELLAHAMGRSPIRSMTAEDFK